jgi:glutaredoxin 2
MLDPAITFSRVQTCPFCERIVRKLNRSDLTDTSRFVEPLYSRRSVIKRESGVRSVSAIVDRQTGVTMAESPNIVDYLDSTYGENADRHTVRSQPEELLTEEGS